MTDRFVDRRVWPGQRIDPLGVMFVRELLERRSAEIKMQAVKRAWKKETGIVLKIQCAHATLRMVAGLDGCPSQSQLVEREFFELHRYNVSLFRRNRVRKPKQSPIALQTRSDELRTA